MLGSFDLCTMPSSSAGFLTARDSVTPGLSWARRDVSRRCCTCGTRWITPARAGRRVHTKEFRGRGKEIPAFKGREGTAEAALGCRPAWPSGTRVAKFDAHQVENLHQGGRIDGANTPAIQEEPEIHGQHSGGEHDLLVKQNGAKDAGRSCWDCTNTSFNAMHTCLKSLSSSAGNREKPSTVERAAWTPSGYIQLRTQKYNIAGIQQPQHRKITVQRARQSIPRSPAESGRRNPACEAKRRLPKSTPPEPKPRLISLQSSRIPATPSNQYPLLSLIAIERQVR